MAGLASHQTYKVVNYLLSHPETSQIEISRKAGVSKNLVSYIVKGLEPSGVLAQRSKDTWNSQTR